MVLAGCSTPPPAPGTAPSAEATPSGSATATATGTAPLSALAGAWEMTRLEVGTAGDLAPVPYSGQVVFTDAGTMSVQARNPDAAAPDGPYTVGGYEAFHGTVAPVDDDSLTVEVDSALAPTLVGQTLARDFAVTGDTLVLTPTDPSEGFRATYQRQG
ncbi:hypothetical protein C5B94_11280 [Clavibacter michiganensis]|nr:hypothetical protein C5B94_11280 [Clavibacter michiganensis]